LLKKAENDQVQRLPKLRLAHFFARLFHSLVKQLRRMIDLSPPHEFTGRHIGKTKSAG
jgi:hypothetical protein